MAPAPPLRCVAAFAIDWLFVVLWLGVLAAIALASGATGMGVSLVGLLERHALARQLFVFAVSVLSVVGVSALMESSRAGATPGKYALRIAVRSSGGDRLGIGRSLVRSALKFVPW